ncbi:MAG TPA: ABC transporter permease [Vicinamibacterales bacterium]|nr:ABC transporter permease [Vicinamibacterales bacterium]
MMTLLRRIAAFFRRDRLDETVAEEIELHLDLRRQSLIDSGMTPEEAERDARLQFGNVTGIRERTRDEWGGSTLDMLRHDVRYGLRLLHKAPGFSAVAIASLAIGIGASTLLFSFANTLLFRPIQASNPEQLVEVFTSDFDGPLYGGSSYADYQNFRTSPAFTGLLASMRAQATVSGDDQRDVIDGLLVSANYFDVLGLRPAYGRFFRADEGETPGLHAVVVLSHDAWRRRFSADPTITGRSVELNGRSFTVIGVAPPQFVGTSVEHVADFFVPAMMQKVISPESDVLRSRRMRTFRILGRLKDGVSAEKANAALKVVAAELLAQDPDAWRDGSGRARIITAVPEVTARFVGEPGLVAVTVGGVMAGALALLAIACVNVATVLLARATTRRKEIAVRLALGASRKRVVRQLLTEAALLAVAGGALGLLITQSAASLFLRFRPAGVPAFNLAIDYRVLLFSIGAALLTVLFFGLVPALQTTRPDVNAELKDMAKTVRLRGFRLGLRSGLVVVQVAVSLALMIGAALMLRSANAGRSADPGFRRDGILNVGINLSTVPTVRDAHARLYREAVEAAAAVPGVERVALAALIPMDGSNTQTGIQLAGASSPAPIFPDMNIVGAGYFGMLDIPLTQGREFTADDRAGTPDVAVVNESMAREYWNGNPLGKTFTVDDGKKQVVIVGVIGDLRHRSFSEEPRPMVYFCAAQRTRPRMTLHVRTTMAPSVIAPALQRTLRGIDRTAGLAAPETMSEFFERMALPQRLGAAGAIATGMLELALTVMALYGVMAFSASQRRREIGLRLALGASKRSVITLIMREGLLLVGVGVVVGVGVALLGGSVLESVLIGIGPADPLSFAGAVLIVCIVGAAASYIPARSASKGNPTTALRSE